MMNKRNILGFTLIELSIVILIISLILGGMMTLYNQRLRAERLAEVNRRMGVIAEALYQYRLANNKLPCPANSSVATSDADFALQADGAAETCQTSSTANTDLQSNINTSNNNVFGGGVPVRTLGLADDYAFDPWGNKFTYYIDAEANNSANFTGTSGTDGVSLRGSLTTTDESGATISAEVFAVIMSHGPNGHGAYMASGVRKSAGITNAAELVDCMCTNAAVASSVTSIAIRIQRNLTTTSTDLKTSFDDMVRTLPRSFFYTYSEKNP
jgi:prepilin-type N-terminal cleavage/methylation domain-containing protein